MQVPQANDSSFSHQVSHANAPQSWPARWPSQRPSSPSSFLGLPVGPPAPSSCSSRHPTVAELGRGQHRGPRHSSRRLPVDAQPANVATVHGLIMLPEPHSATSPSAFRRRRRPPLVVVALLAALTPAKLHQPRLALGSGGAARSTRRLPQSPRCAHPRAPPPSPTPPPSTPALQSQHRYATGHPRHCGHSHTLHCLLASTPFPNPTAAPAGGQVMRVFSSFLLHKSSSVDSIKLAVQVAT